MKRDIVIITGSAGLVGSEATRFFSARGFDVVGIDNDMRSQLFGPEASTEWNRHRLEEALPAYRHVDADIRDQQAMDALFSEYAPRIALVIHAAAQPSHDWAARDPHADFTINAGGTLNLLERCRQHCARSAVRLHLDQQGLRRHAEPAAAGGARDALGTIGQTTRSPGTASTKRCRSTRACTACSGFRKSAADVLVQEYGRYFGMKTVCFRGGCLTGPSHSGTALHGFLAYLMKCTATGSRYQVFGYKGKQVRDNIHSDDLVSAFWHFFQNPALGRGLQHGRRSRLQLFHAGSDRDLPGRSPAGASIGPTAKTTAPATISGGFRIRAASANTIPAGRSPAACPRSSRKSIWPTDRDGGRKG